MHKKLLALALVAASAGSANAALSQGDLAFTSFNADEDGWAMVALSSIAANTKVYFSDNEWNSTGTAFNTGESFSSWVTGGAAIGAGTVIRFSKIDSSTLLAASVGTLARETVTGSANWGLSATLDTLYAYLGTTATAPTTFLAAISSGTFGTATDGSLTNTGLSVGNGAIQLKPSSDYAEYSGARTGQADFAAYKPLVGTIANWNDLGDGSFAANVPNTTAFTISPIPEPGTYAMLLAGLGLIGTMIRRSRSV